MIAELIKATLGTGCSEKGVLHNQWLNAGENALHL